MIAADAALSEVPTSTSPTTTTTTTTAQAPRGADTLRVVKRGPSSIFITPPCSCSSHHHSACIASIPIQDGDGRRHRAMRIASRRRDGEEQRTLPGGVTTTPRRHRDDDAGNIVVVIHQMRASSTAAHPTRRYSTTYPPGAPARGRSIMPREFSRHIYTPIRQRCVAVAMHRRIAIFLLRPIYQLTPEPRINPSNVMLATNTHTPPPPIINVAVFDR